MKKPTLFLMYALCVGSSLVHAQSPSQTPAQKAEASYRQGVAAEKAGDPEAARRFYAEALQAYPGHANARYSLGQLKLTSGAVAAKGREAKFGAVMLPAYQLEDASVQEALDALRVIVTRESKEEVTPNFVLDDPEGKLSGRKISLNLKNMPAKAVLKYVTEMAGAKARFDEHAVVIQPHA